MQNEMEAFLDRLDALPSGSSEGLLDSRRWGVTLARSADGRRCWLYAEERGGTGRVSCNIYRPAGGPPRLRPCEMPLARVVGFVLRFRASSAAAAPSG
jgi:hypothetical protein